MKKLIKTVVILCFVLSVACVGAVTCLAVEIDGQQIHIGDTVTYEIRASGCPKPVQGVGASIYYDSGTLQYASGSIELPLLKGQAVNDGLQDQIIFNAVDLNGFDFFNDNVLARVTFTVISEYNPYPRLSFEVNSFIDADGADFGDIYTYDVVTVTASGSPVVSTVSSVASNFVASGETTAPISSETFLSKASNSSSLVNSQAYSSNNAGSSGLSQNNESEQSVLSQGSQETETHDSPDIVSQAKLPKELSLSYAVVAIIAVAVLGIAFLFIRLANSRGKHIE